MIECFLPSFFTNRAVPKRALGAVAEGARAAGRQVEIVDKLTGRADLVVIWGAGHPYMQSLLRLRAASGFPTVAWDGAYWRRDSSYRCSFNAAHPEAVVMQWPRSPERWNNLGIPLRSLYKPDGHIVLVGMGVKCAAQYDEPVGLWEREVLSKIRAQSPDRTVHFRPRPNGIGHLMNLPGCVTRREAGIEDVLRGASLVVTRHSNVAVDAIIAGVPVVSVSGAAAAVCPTRIEDAAGPLANNVRQQFLWNLAWFNWSLDEMRQAETWRMIEEMAT